MKISRFTHSFNKFINKNKKKMINLISLVSIFVLGVIGWITYKIFIWPFYVSPLRKIPGPPSENPFSGNIETLLTERVTYFLYF
jgi:hypothetical protein